MNEQQKLEILCAYLPYGIDVQSPTGNVFILGTYCNMRGSGKEKRNIEVALNDGYKPILRHPDDMTKDELRDISVIWGKDAVEALTSGFKSVNLTLDGFISLTKYLHSNHIDTFGAIESGFAIRKCSNQ